MVTLTVCGESLVASTFRFRCRKASSAELPGSHVLVLRLWRFRVRTTLGDLHLLLGVDVLHFGVVGWMCSGVVVEGGFWMVIEYCASCRSLSGN